MSTFGQILKEVGEFGLSQKQLLAALCIPSLFAGLSFPHHCNTDWILERGPNLTDERQRNLTIPVNKDGRFENCKMFTPVDLDLETIEAYGINTTAGCRDGWDNEAPTEASSVVTELEMEGTSERRNMLDIFRISYLRKRTSIMGYNWFSTSLLYYGLSLNVGSFGLNIYLTQFIFGAAEIPALLGGLALIQHFGRRISQAGFLFFGGTVCLVVLAIAKGTFITLEMFLSSENRILTIIAVLGKFAATASFSTAYIYTAVLYPTIVRQNGVGVNSTCACVAGILAPLIRLLEVYHHTIPMLIYGVVPIAAEGFCLLLPETLNAELQDHTEIKTPTNGPTANRYRAEQITEEHKL